MIKRSVHLQLGKTPHNPANAPKLKFKDYLDLATLLPTLPAEFGHENFISSNAWGMLGNDTLGDCVEAGMCHETMLWHAEAAGATTATVVPFTTANATAIYSAITGYKPNHPNTDKGTDMAVAAAYRRKTGIADANGRLHKIDAYLALTAGNLQEHLLAAYLFGAVGVGIEFPNYAMDQFNAGKPWDVEQVYPTIEGGHYVPIVAYRGGNLEVVTWGRTQEMTPAFFQKFNDESYVYLSEETLSNDKTPEGFNLAQLKADLKAVTSVPAA